MKFENSRSFAEDLDKKDPLKKFRDRFFIPVLEEKETIYFAGNSLGLQPRSAPRSVQQELDDWAAMGVDGHLQAGNPWLPYHEIFPQQLSGILGCSEKEVVVMNSLTVNLHLLLVSFYRPTPKRYKIICEARAFPSDQYAFESQAGYHGLDPSVAVVEVKPRPGEHSLRTEDILATITEHGESVAVVLFAGVNYYTGQVFDMKAITEAAHNVGAYAGFDLAHAVGNVALDLHEWTVDFACWCSYKYLNSGPGGVAGVYIHEKHATNPRIPRFAGWWGHTKETRFRMEKGFEAIPTAEGWQLSNAPVLAMAVHKASLDIFMEAGMDNLYQKRQIMSDYLFFILDDINTRQKEKRIGIITPAGEKEKGCQVSMLMLKNGRRIFAALEKQGVVADWREPDVIRVAPVPLYNSFSEIWRFGQIIETILNE